ncbi:hypothetical protein ACEPPN_007471 [Leptodophora sp. 'Broadleaf-Isolate-01']
MHRIRELMKQRGGPSTEASSSRNVTRFSDTLCQECSKINATKNTEHHSVGELVDSTDLGCPCCRLIKGRMEETAPPIKESSIPKRVNTEIWVNDNNGYGRYITWDFDKYPLEAPKSKVLVEGLSSAMVYKSAPDSGLAASTPFEFFRMRTYTFR